MDDSVQSKPLPELQHNIFQKAAGDLLVQRIESILDEVRAIGSPMARTLADSTTLSLIAMLLQRTLTRIDGIFELNGFVFSPACSIILELFQARISGIVISEDFVCQVVNSPEPVTRRWVGVLETMQLVEKASSESDGAQVTLTERGYLKAIEALKLLL